MGKLQHRRSIGIRGQLYARLKAHCRHRGLPIAAYVTAAILDALDDDGAPEVMHELTGYPKRNRERPEQIAAELATRPPAHILL